MAGWLVGWLNYCSSIFFFLDQTMTTYIYIDDCSRYLLAIRMVDSTDWIKPKWVNDEKKIFKCLFHRLTNNNNKKNLQQLSSNYTMNYHCQLFLSLHLLYFSLLLTISINKEKYQLNLFKKNKMKRNTGLQVYIQKIKSNTSVTQINKQTLVASLLSVDDGLPSYTYI